MRLRIGTSGFSYAPWRGSFYPADLAAERMLAFYAARFDTVEINNTFYRMPAATALEGWAREVPEGFGFALKAPRYVVPKFVAAPDRADPVDAFFSLAALLGPKLGPALVTIPPSKVADAPLLAAFLDRFPKGRPIAVELRGPAWQTDEVLAVLREKNAALCITDADDGTTPVVATGSFVYARLRRTKYTRKDLAAWAKRLEGLGVGEAFVFFKHEDEGTGPRFAAALRAIVGGG